MKVRNYKECKMKAWTIKNVEWRLELWRMKACDWWKQKQNATNKNAPAELSHGMSQGVDPQGISL